MVADYGEKSQGLFIIVDVSAVDWLVTVVGACGVLAGLSEFNKSR